MGAGVFLWARYTCKSVSVASQATGKTFEVYAKVMYMCKHMFLLYIVYMCVNKYTYMCVHTYTSYVIVLNFDP